jgi:subtilisin-like proprotein convertase family protein
LEPLEKRQLLATLDTDITNEYGIVDTGKTFGVVTSGGVDYSNTTSVVGGATSAESIVEQQIRDLFTAASDVNKYTNDQLAASRTWAVAVKPGANISALELQLGSKLVPSQIINNVYVYASPLMSDGMSKELLAANAKNTASLLKQNANIGGFMPLYPNTGADETFSLNPNPPTDPLYRQGLQWHLTNTGQFGGPGTSINAVNAWNQASGRGVAVTVVDSGLFWQHEDLISRYRQNMSADFKDFDTNPAPEDVAEAHGTNVGGLIASSANNNAGGLGVAPEAALAGIKLDFENGWTALTEAQFMEYGGRELQVSNNSWGATAAASTVNPLTAAAFYRDITFGRGGLGAIILFATGNSAFEGQEANLKGRVGNRYTMGITGVGADGKRAGYGSFGSAVDVSAPTQGANFGTDVGMTTTDYVDDDTLNSYTNTFNGTSAATPVAAGVAALVLEANPTLSWRDVRAVMELSAQKVDASHSGWFTNAAGHDINEDYGFGMVDAAAAVALAKTWTNYTPERAYTSGNTTINRGITTNGLVTSFTVNQNLKVDQAEITFRIQHDSPEDVQVALISPSGTRVNLVHEARTPVASGGFGTVFQDGYTVATDFFRDEVSLGTWRIVVSDKLGAPSGLVNDLQLNIYGRDNGPTPPAGGTGPATINGYVWNDLDADGVDEVGEPRMANVVVYIDVDNNGSISINEPSAVTNGSGVYSLRNVAPGPIVVRQSVPLGYRQNFPGGDGGYHNSPQPGEVRQNVKFGNTAGFDYGDARSSHGTQTAKHSIIPGVSLGASVDAEVSAVTSLEALGDDVRGTDDENGVAFPGFGGAAAGTGIQGTLVPGQTTTSVVTVSTGGKSAGLLHVWADFNQDGDFTDAGEKIVNNLRLGTGTFNVNIPTPGSAKTGTTYLRYRYSYDQNLSATGAALGGEIEDYRVQVLSSNPQPQPDVFSVRKFSLNNVLNVLSNDIPSTAGPLTITAVNSFSAGGSATISPDGKQLLYTPRANYLGQETFLYTVRDPSGKTAQTNVTITVLPLSDLPIAVDDSFSAGLNAAPQSLNVMANDTIGTGGPIFVTNVTTPTGGGFVTIGPGGTSVNYTPSTGFAGVETFNYTVTNGLGASSTAQVTMTITPNADANDLVQFRVETTNLAGTPISSINVGQEFLVRTWVYDLRPTSGADAVPANTKGVFSAHSDLLYNSNLAYVKRDATNPRGFDVVWGPNFTNNRSGSVAVDSIIDEIGALRDPALIASPAGDVEQLLSSVKMVASAGGTLVFKTNPFDGATSDVTLQVPTTQVSFDRVRHGTASITINGSAEPSSRGAGTSSVASVISPLREALRQEASAITPPAAAPESTDGVDAALATWTPTPRSVDIPTYGGSSSAKKSDAAVISLFASGR